MDTPPFHLTNSMIQLVSEISEQIGQISFWQKKINEPNWQRQNHIRIIHSSLAIEQNSLSLEQVTAILDGKPVLGNPVEIREVKNAHQTYELLTQLNPLSIDDLLQAHHLMMNGLIGESGRFRSSGVGIFAGQKLIHMAPPAQFVPSHIFNLLEWYKHSDLHPLIKSSIFHYEFEFIHPFMDGNGHLGRLWHHLLLGQ